MLRIKVRTGFEFSFFEIEPKAGWIIFTTDCTHLLPEHTEFTPTTSVWVYGTCVTRSLVSSGHLNILQM